MRGTMILLMGPTGCGKTTYRKKHYRDLPCISPDDFIRGQWTPKKASLCWALARGLAVELLQEGQSFVMDAQFTEEALREEWCRLAHGFEFDVVAVVMHTPWRQLQKNQKKRGSRGLYGTIPYAVLLRNYQTFRDQIKAGKIRGRINHFRKNHQPDGMAIVHWGKWQRVRKVSDCTYDPIR